MDGDEAWFTPPSDPGTSKVLRYSRASFFVDAEEYYADLRQEVEATGKGGQICWIGFDAGGYDPAHTAVDVPMPSTAASGPKPFARRASQPGDATWLDVLTTAANTRDVSIRALLNLHPAPSPPTRHQWGNLHIVAKLNALRNTLAINDFRYLWLNGTHHQKLILVENESGLSAYVGTADVHFQRITDRWCEVHTKLRGEAALELYRVFYQRYMEHTALLKATPSALAYLRPPDQVTNAKGGGKILIQVATTYGNPQRVSPVPVVGPHQQFVNQPHRVTLPVHHLLPAVSLLLSGSPPVQIGNDFFTEKEPGASTFIDQARQQSRTYGFAPTGSTGIYRLIRDGVAHSRQFIYLEDQYLVCDQPMGSLPPMLDHLVAKLKEPQFKKLIVLGTRLDEINIDFQGTAASHRRAFVEALVAAGGDKVVICQYKSNAALSSGIGPPEASPFYVHSKTWIFDDEYLVVGSANCNRRGYSHDSELDIGAYDVEKAEIRDLRVRMWLKRLNTEGVKSPISRAALTDFASGARFWERPADFGLTIENHRIGIDAFLPGSASPQIVYDGGGYGPVVDLGALVGSAKAQLLWDIAVDPDGT